MKREADRLAVVLAAEAHLQTREAVRRLFILVEQLVFARAFHIEVIAFNLRHPAPLDGILRLGVHEELRVVFAEPRLRQYHAT